MTFIEFDNVWIQANMRENNIANIEPGDSVDIALDVAPGKVFKGKVSSVGFAVGSDHADQVGGLVTIESKSGWLRDAQRFPVIIVFDDERANGLRRLGGQADVLVYTGNNWIINPLGWLYIRLLSLFSYVY
jgi:multidrug resistance efflux pump